MSAATAHPDIWADVLNWLAIWWWLALIIGGTVLEWLGETFDVGLAALHRRSKRRHKRRLQLKQMELEIARAKAGIVPSSSLPKPGPCVHRNVTAVIGSDDAVKAWLCRSCDTQLPPDWAVREEDL